MANMMGVGGCLWPGGMVLAGGGGAVCGQHKDDVRTKTPDVGGGGREVEDMKMMKSWRHGESRPVEECFLGGAGHFHGR